MTENRLTPAAVFRHFSAINAIPRPSKHEEKMISYLKNWGESHDLDTAVDNAGNVRIRKGATPGYENRQTVTLQSHIDMVCDKLVDVDFNFMSDPIQTFIDGEWLRAKGTTLGADDGIGVAMELALLEADDVSHGPIECIFTRDEEQGLSGAAAMAPDFMSGAMLINLDSEDEGQFFVSCAGGKTTTARFTFRREDAPQGSFFVRISVKGLRGGHSGDDIDKQRANAIKLLARFVYKEMSLCDARLASFNSGRMHNAIPRDGAVVLAIPNAEKELTRARWNVFAAEVEDEYHATEGAMEFRMESCEAEKVLPNNVGRKVIAALQAVDNGVFALCQDEALAGIVETSTNTASVTTNDDTLTIVASQRSNVESALENQLNTVRAAFELAGAEVESSDGYPAWKMNPKSELTKIVADTYRKLFAREPIIRGIHAGLECGLFAKKRPNMDMISMGPTLRNVHTPDEMLLIPTVNMVWEHLKEILKNIPEK